MVINEITAKSILRRFKKVDSWFVARYGMNLYRGCLHNCTYCDGRAEKYQVGGDFGREVTVKTNAVELLEKELDLSRKRTPWKKGFILVGGGVGDSYQPPESKYRLTRATLELMIRFKHPVHILTKSTLVERDLDLLTTINRSTRALVSMSFSSMDRDISRRFEPGVPPPEERLSMLRRFKNQGIAVGVFLMPVIPYVTDTHQILEHSLQKTAEAGMDYLIFGGMTLKPGRQQEYLFSFLTDCYPHLLEKYHFLYRQADPWGNADSSYYQNLNTLFRNLCLKTKLPKRIPPVLWKDMLDETDRVIVILEHLDYLLKLRGEKSPYGYGAFSLSRLKEPLIEYQGDLKQLKGVGPVTESIVKEILQTGTCSYYDAMIND